MRGQRRVPEFVNVFHGFYFALTIGDILTLEAVR
jgi:hypothetical protein